MIQQFYSWIHIQKNRKQGLKEVFVVALFIIAQNCKPKCLPTDEWINKMWHIHAMEYFSAIKRNKVLLHATTWMNFENIILSGRNYTASDTKGHILHSSI